MQPGQAEESPEQVSPVEPLPGHAGGHGAASRAGRAVEELISVHDPGRLSVQGSARVGLAAHNGLQLK